MARKRKPGKNVGTLSARHRAFVREYLLCLNATQAAIHAGYSERTARSAGQRMLTFVDIRAAIEDGLKARDLDSAVLRKRVLHRWEAIAFADPRAVMSWGPEGLILKQSDRLTDDEVAQVSDVSYVESDRGLKTCVRRKDSLRALEMLGRHLGMFEAPPPARGSQETPLEKLAGVLAKRRTAMTEAPCTKS